MTHPAWTIPFDELYAGLQTAIEANLVFKQNHNGLELFHHSNECTYSKQWDSITTSARGLILDPANKKIIATPFPKFFNYGEISYSLPNTSFTVSEKIDGSFGIVFWHNGWQVATKGSFNSDQSKWAAKYLQNKDLSCLDKDTTYLFEIVYPQNRIVIKYDFAGLYLLSGYKSGVELATEQLNEIALALEVPRPKSFNYSIDQLLQLAKTLSGNEEGFVVRFEDGTRTKIKGDEYCRIHKLIANITPLAVWEAMANLDDMEKIIREIPEEFRKDTQLIIDILNKKHIDIVTQVEALHQQTIMQTDKDFAIQHDKGLIRNLVLAKRHNKFFPYQKGKTRMDIFKSFRPTANNLDGYMPTSAMNRFQDDET